MSETVLFKCAIYSTSALKFYFCEKKWETSDLKASPCYLYKYFMTPEEGVKEIILLMNSKLDEGDKNEVKVVWWDQKEVLEFLRCSYTLGPLK